MDKRSPSVRRRRQSTETNNPCATSDDLHRLASVFEEHQEATTPNPPSTTSTLRSRHETCASRTGRTPNIAFVIDLLENATSKGTLTDAEAINAFDQWLTDRIAPYYADSTTSQRLVTSDDSGLGSQGRCYHSDSCPSAQTSISDSSGVLSSVSEPSLSPRPRLRRSESLNHRHRSTGRIFVKSISRLFAACGAPKPASSPPTEDSPWKQQRPNPHVVNCPLRRASADRPLPQVPSSASVPVTEMVKEEPVYAEYDALGGVVMSSSPSPPAMPDEDFDSIYDEADETQFVESCDTLTSVTTSACHPKASGHVNRLDSGFDSV